MDDSSGMHRGELERRSELERRTEFDRPDMLDRADNLQANSIQKIPGKQRESLKKQQNDMQRTFERLRGDI